MRKLYLLIILAFIALTALYCRKNAENTSSMESGPGHYKILKDRSLPIRIPFRMHNGKPLMDLKINGEKATLMIDNGILWDRVWLFGTPLVDKLDLQPVEDSVIGGSGEGDPTSAYTSSDLTLEFQDITFYDQPVLVSPPAAGFDRMFPGADGQLCNTFFRHFIVEFDFIDNIIILHNPDNFLPGQDYQALTMTTNESGSYAVPFSIKMLDGIEYHDKVDLDFGGIYPLKIALNNKYDIKLPEDVEETFSYGAQGRNSEFRGRIASMTLGEFTFTNPTVTFGDKSTSRIHPENLGVLGLPLFMKFHTIFDYFNNLLYLKPNENYPDSFSLNRSNVSMNRNCESLNGS